MNTVIDRNAEKVRKNLITADEAADLKRMTEFRLSDAMRLGAKVSGQAYGWTGEGDTMCALSSALAGAKGAGYID